MPAPDPTPSRVTENGNHCFCCHRAYTAGAGAMYSTTRARDSTSVVAAATTSVTIVRDSPFLKDSRCCGHSAWAQRTEPDATAPLKRLHLTPLGHRRERMALTLHTPERTLHQVNCRGRKRRPAAPPSPATGGLRNQFRHLPSALRRLWCAGWPPAPAGSWSRHVQTSSSVMEPQRPACRTRHSIKQGTAKPMSRGTITIPSVWL